MAAIQSIRTIVAATDFSEDATAAVAWAAEVARERSARLVLMHATSVATPIGPEFIPIPDQLYAELRAEGRAKLDHEAEALEKTGLAVATAFGNEPAAAAILEVARMHHADLIVAGNRGLTGWKRIALGSVAARLVRKASCPVVTVHPGDGGRHRPVRTILVPTDFSDDAARAAEAASAILGEGGPDRRLVLVHACRHPLLFKHAAKPTLATSAGETLAVARQEMAILAGRLSREGVRIETEVMEGFPPEVILEQARRVGADLIAMGTYGRSGLDRLFLGSTAERVLSSAPCPILTVRDTSASERST